MSRRDYKRNEKTDLLVAVALIVAMVGVTVIVVMVLFTLNNVFFGS